MEVFSFQVWIHVPRDMTASIFVSALMIRTSAIVEWDMCWTQTRKHAHLRIWTSQVDFMCVSWHRFPTNVAVFFDETKSACELVFCITTETLLLVEVFMEPPQQPLKELYLWKALPYWLLLQLWRLPLRFRLFWKVGSECLVEFVQGQAGISSCDCCYGVTLSSVPQLLVETVSYM